MQTTSYIAFLRAINVGGRFVKMEILRALFVDLGFTNVRSFIQSGNIFFDAPAGDDRALITRKIEERLAAALGYEVAALVRTVPELEAVVALNPFRDTAITPDTRLCVLFISHPLPDTVELPVSSRRGDCQLLAATSGEIFVVMRQIDGRPGNPVAYVEKTYRLTATARFFGAVVKILESAKQLPCTK